MLFNSFTFVFFLLLAFAGYWGLGRMKDGRVLQNVFLLLASYVFYGWWDARFLALIVISSGVDFLCGWQMGEANRPEDRRPWLWLSLGVNLGMLGFFKYFDFFSESLQVAFAELGVDLSFPLLNIILPVGISFYTFQTLSYTIDIYRGHLKPTRDPIAFFAFVSFFPQLVAGPIERARDLLPQFGVTRRFDRGFAVTGLRLMLWGFFKKMVVADRLGSYVDAVYFSPEEYSGTSLALATIFFATQIYCDFSGYSDIAIGVARLFGFRLSTNFRSPYLATSLRDFWARWHITLTGWFRDYVYLPLGGNRVPKIQWALNILAVFLVSGLWHGAAWGFLVWGALHGVYYLIERELKLNWEKWGIPGIGWLATLGLVAFAWIFFRAPYTSEWRPILHRLFSGGPLDLFQNFPSELDLYFSNAGEMLYLIVLCGVWWAVEVFLGKRDSNNRL